MRRTHPWRTPLVTALALLLVSWSTSATAQLSSYATAAVDVVGVTGADDASLGVPDYLFINDKHLGFGGTNIDVFEVGESVVLSFPVALRNIPGQDDLVVSAFVGGLGQTDNAIIQVEASSNGTAFFVVDSFATEDARDPQEPESPYLPEADFDSVKHFRLDFGSEDFVKHIRLTNLSGTAEGLRLDAVEGLHPVVGSDHAFEIRFDRYRPDFNGRFFVRIKNIADVGGVPIREFRMNRSTTPGSTLEDTDESLYTALTKRGQGIAGESFICVENCIPDNGPLIDFARHEWSLDGVVVAPPGLGLDPGRQARHPRELGAFDTDNTDYLAGMSFQVTFADGVTHEFTYDDDVIQVLGELYQKYLYFDSTPAESGPRPTDYYEFVAPVPVQVPTLSTRVQWLLAAFALLTGGWYVRARRHTR